MNYVLCRACLLALLFCFGPAYAIHNSDGEASFEGRNIPPDIVDGLKRLPPVSPSPGVSGDTFTFSVDYYDEDNDPPTTFQVWIDLDQNGRQSANEKFDMTLKDGDKDVGKEAWGSLNWKGWQHFSFTLPLSNKTNNIAFPFQFIFSDGKDAAVPALSFQPYTDVGEVAVYTAVVAVREKRTYETVPGANLRVEVPLYVHKKRVNGTEFSFDLIDRMKLPHGFTLRGHTLSQRSYNRDYALVTVALEFALSSETKETLYTLAIPPIQHAFADEKEKKRTKKRQWEALALSPVDVRTVALSMRPLELSAHAVTLGTAFDYQFSVLFRADSEEKDDVVSVLDAKTFAPFRLISRKIQVIEHPGKAHELFAHYVLSLEDAVPGVHLLPELLIGKVKLPETPVVLHAINPPAKMAESEGEMDELMRSLKRMAQPTLSLESMTKERSPLYFKVAGAAFSFAALLLAAPFVGWVIKTSRRKLKLNKERKSRFAEYREAKVNYETTGSRNDLAALYHTLRAYLLLKYNRPDIPKGMTVEELVQVLSCGDDQLSRELAQLSDRWFGH